MDAMGMGRLLIITGLGNMDVELAEKYSNSASVSCLLKYEFFSISAFCPKSKKLNSSRFWQMVGREKNDHLEIPF